jgi:hypothetical protein
MAEVRKVTLSFPTIGADTVQVKVDYELVFTAEERGKTFKIAVELLGVDGLGDTPLTLPVPGWEHILADLRFTFRIPLPRPVVLLGKYGTITVGDLTATGTVTNSIKRSALNEDSGTDRIIIFPERPPVFLERTDEITARVILIPNEKNIGISNVMEITA